MPFRLLGIWLRGCQPIPKAADVETIYLVAPEEHLRSVTFCFHPAGKCLVRVEG